MSTALRGVVLTALVALALAVGGAPAHADGDRGLRGGAQCSGTTCEVQVRTESTSAGGGSAGAGSAPQGGGAVPTVPAVPAGPSCTEGASGAARCEATVSAAGIAGEGEAGGVDWAAQAEEVRASMRVPVPVVGAAPPLDADRVVGVPVWMWVEEVWEPVGARAAVPGGSVSVTAAPVSVRWEMGDGETVVCDGPGTVFTGANFAPGGSPDCGHTYLRASHEEPEGAFEVEAAVEWEVVWEASSGEGGQLDPLTSTAAERVRVVEVHALVTGG